MGKGPALALLLLAGILLVVTIRQETGEISSDDIGISHSKEAIYSINLEDNKEVAEAEKGSSVYIVYAGTQTLGKNGSNRCNR